MTEYLDANGNPIEEKLYRSETLLEKNTINIFYAMDLGKDKSGEEIWVAHFPGKPRRLTIDKLASCYPLSDGEIENLKDIIEMSEISREEQLLKIKNKLGFMAK